MDALLRIADKPARDLGEAFPDCTISGVTVLAVVVDPHFVMPVSTGPTDEQIAAFPEFERRVMAATLKALAERWQP